MVMENKEISENFEIVIISAVEVNLSFKSLAISVVYITQKCHWLEITPNEWILKGPFPVITNNWKDYVNKLEFKKELEIGVDFY